MFIVSQTDLTYLQPTWRRNRIDVIRTLLAMREEVCVYTGPPCDCKYGREKSYQRPYSEQSGCPELAEAAALLARLDDREYEEIMKRAPLYLQDFGANT